MTLLNTKTVKYINGILTPWNVDKYIPLDRNMCTSYIPPTNIEEIMS